MDIVGPLEEVQGHKYLLTWIDRCTRWPEAFPLKEITAAKVARTFINGWISRLGVPRHIISDRGAQFTSRLWTELGKFLGVSTNHTAAYHPQANGMVERFHRHLKSVIMAKTDGNIWLDVLPWALLGIRTMTKDDIGYSLAQMIYGATVAVPADFITGSSTSQEPKKIAEHLETIFSGFWTPQIQWHGNIAITCHPT